MIIKSPWYDTYIDEPIDFKKYKASKVFACVDGFTKTLLDKIPKIDHVIEFPTGETAKTFAHVEEVCNTLAKLNADRKALIVALGGGVVGDVAGFVASIYKRGISYVQIPTTLLAQVDSSFGGKTGVNLTSGKNLVGTIWQPKAVHINLDFLKKLPEKEIQNGMAEVVKYGCVLNRDLFEFLEKEKSWSGENFFRKIIIDSCRAKIQVVSKDEREEDFRQVLNFGHTVGHALEILSGYKLSHGQAVALGMEAELKIALELKCIEEADYTRMQKLVWRIGFPHQKFAFDREEVVAIMENDKKNTNGEICFALPTGIGEVKHQNGKICLSADRNIIKKAVQNLL